MHFFRDCGDTDFCSCKIGIQYLLYISSVLVRQPGRSSCIPYTLRFCAQYFLALIAMDGMYAGFAGAKACQKKLLFLKLPLKLAVFQ